MEVRLVEVPYHAGDGHHPSSHGPRKLLEAGAAEMFGAVHTVDVVTIDRGEPFTDSASSSAVVNRRLAAAVRAAAAAGEFPFVLAGSCTASHGVVAGIGEPTGVVWIDAHADFNTPETTRTGFFPGMSLAVLTGHCFRTYFAKMGGVPVAEHSVALLGVRDLAPAAERERLEASEIRFVEWSAGKPRTPVIAALDAVAERVHDVYLHIDIDGFTPEIAPGVADDPVPGGLSLSDATAIIDATAERFKILAATLATYAPSRDQDDSTLSLCLRLVEMIGGRIA